VFANLGYAVERTGQSGDHGVDLVVVNGGRRVAIQAKGYVNSVSNSAVQEAFTGKTIWKCHACAVITNSRFTSNAIDAAKATRCTLIGEDNFQDFVFGRIVFP
jgi:restriction system protein